MKKKKAKILSKITLFCRDNNIIEYKNYVKDLINNSEFEIFNQVIIKEFKIEYNSYKNFNEFINDSFKLIKISTKSLFDEEYLKFLKSKSIEQIGTDIIYNSNRIIRIEEEDLNSSIKYYLENRFLYENIGDLYKNTKITTYSISENRILCQCFDNKLVIDNSPVIKYRYPIKNIDKYKLCLNYSLSLLGIGNVFSNVLKDNPIE